MFNFDEASKKSKEAMDGMLKSYSEIAKGYQAIATEATDYSKKSFQDMTGFMEALASTRSVEAAFELQTNYVKSAYESFIAESTKITDMYADLAKTAYKPYEAPVAKSTAMVTANAA
ncbi:phasin family protein [Neorhizobium galegae]|uniref:phasin family protein n=1 Tax=Neorhizobium galegae TaxID=399 RepID=UPI0006227825|nr:phasin family protein [Neorhizobium galegae]CDZ29213.1 Phasin family protein [Neorhizobium galegae bv. officinalis]KAA9387009.1 phasin family protein [Neorhizobium galegae]KAB1116121.1 phasin family protein [Neorhizobium galegae]MCM2499994.1 phasin family protein [Neorhizobium galegae]MCQ1764879.1 phasin family protein [Neorhizobium galegae]